MPEKNALTLGISALSFMGSLFLPLRQTRSRRVRRTYDSLPWLVVHACRHGLGCEVARDTASRLQALGRQPVVLPLAELTFEQLVQTRRALFIVSSETWCQQVEDHGRVESLLGERRVLNGLQFAMLDLGNSIDGSELAGRLHGWLESQSGTARYPLIHGSDADGLTLPLWHSSIDGWASRQTPGPGQQPTRPRGSARQAFQRLLTAQR